jgi:hypothetical protein
VGAAAPLVQCGGHFDHSLGFGRITPSVSVKITGVASFNNQFMIHFADNLGCAT